MQESKSFKVLIVEDQLIQREVLGRFLRKLGINYRWASNALDAMELVSDRSFSLVLMDIRMDGVDGLETVRFLRGLNHSYFKKLPIIALSAYKKDEMYKEIIDAGMNDYLSKPVSFEELKVKLDFYMKMKTPFI